MKSGQRTRSGFVLAALGLIYGDLATSPLYVMKFIVADSGGVEKLSEALVLGSLSLILWALLFLVTVKGVLLLLRADNQGEGGLFALYALVRGHGHRLLLPAALGGAALLADSVLTPALTLTSAVEGSRCLTIGTFRGFNTVGTVVLVLIFLSALFFVQGLGNRRTGRFLGPVMLVWLLFIGAAGAAQLTGSAAVLRAFDPRIGIRFLFSAGNASGFALLGLVFLSVTGTEILYANLDFAGRKAITRAWPFVLICLCLNYLGQGAWLMKQLSPGGGIAAEAADPFFRMLPPGFRLPALLLGLAAAWGASQTVVNGSFTIVSEAIRLNLLPPLKIRYPSDSIRQEFIPAVNFLMWLFGCAAVVAFQSGQRMASVYGLSTAAAMLSTSILLFSYCGAGKPGFLPLRGLILFFGLTEACFLLTSLEKLLTGGVVTLLLTLLLLAAMLSWNLAGEIEKRFSGRLPIRNYLPKLEALRSDRRYGKLADHLVYIDSGTDPETVDQAILYSLLDRGPKRAGAYWFVTVSTAGEPNLQRYQVEAFGTDCVFRLRLDLGYRCSRPLTWYLRNVLLDMRRQGLAPDGGRRYHLTEESALGSFHYCILRRRPSGFEDFSMAERWALRLRDLLQGLAGLREEWYTEEDTDVGVEWLPLSLMEEEPVERIRRLIRGDQTSASPDDGEQDRTER